MGVPGRLLFCLILGMGLCAPGWADGIGGPASPAAAVGAGAPPVELDQFRLIPDVPSYIWYHGCGPTAMGMVVGYWDAHGFDRLIPGSNDWQSNQQAIKDVIASPGHVADYALYDGVNDADPNQWPHSEPYPDLSELDPSAAHQADCLADWAQSSWSSRGLKYGWSYMSTHPGAMMAYAWMAGQYLSNGYERQYYAGLWDELRSAIDAGRPVELLVDSNADGRSDHFVVAIGYDSSLGEERYACYNTWDHEVHWFEFAPLGAGQPWGVYGAVFFQPVPEPTLLLPLVFGMIVMLRRRNGSPRRVPDASGRRLILGVARRHPCRRCSEPRPAGAKDGRR